MAWIYLFLAGLLEIVWAISLKYSENFTKLLPSLIILVAMLSSILLLTNAMRTLPVGTAYAIWTGLGAVGVAVLGILLFKESVSLLRIVSLCLIVLGIIGLKITH